MGVGCMRVPDRTQPTPPPDSSGLLEQSGTVEKKEKAGEEGESKRLSTSQAMAVVGAASKWRSMSRKKAMRRKLSDYLDQMKGNHDDVLDTVLRNISAWNFDVFEVSPGLR